MLIDVLVVDSTPQVGLDLIAQLELSNMSVTFVDKLITALNCVKKNYYNIIILGDRITGGSTFDIGLELKAGGRNRHTPVVCIGKHVGRNYKLLNLLSPYSLLLNDVVVYKLNSYVDKLISNSSGN